MKELLSRACFIVLVLVSSVALAQTGTICLYADPAGTECTLSDNAPGVLSVYVIHAPLLGVGAAVFAAPKPDCMVGATWITDSSPFSLSGGDSQTGATVVYGQCITEPTHILTIQYMVSGLSQTDCPYGVVKAPANQYIEVVQCDYGSLKGTGGTTYVNSTLPCECSIPSGPPELSVTPSSLDFGNRTQDRFVVLENAGGEVLTWSITESAPWLSVYPTSGQGDRWIGFGVDRHGLPLGTYSTEVSVTSNGGTLTVHVSMEVAPILVVSPTSLRFEADQSVLPFDVRNNGSGTLEWSVSWDQPWLSAHPTQGVNNGTVYVEVNRTGLADGTYTGNVKVSGGREEATVAITMVVASAPQLSVRPTVLTFTSVSTPQTFRIENVGTGLLEWSMSADRPWISISPPLSGSGDKTVSVQVAPPGPPRPEDGQITVQSNGGSATVLIRYQLAEGLGGTIGAYADPQALQCNILDHAPGLMTVYVVHVVAAGASGSQFASPMPLCMTGVTYLGETSPFAVVLGNSQTGVSIGYGSCLSGSIHLLTLRFFGQGTSQTCCPYPTGPDPHGQTQINVVDCDYNTLYGIGAVAIVNPDASCPCGSVPAQETTWGHIKSMYSTEGDR